MLNFFRTSTLREDKKRPFTLIYIIKLPKNDKSWFTEFERTLSFDSEYVTNYNRGRITDSCNSNSIRKFLFIVLNIEKHLYYSIGFMLLLQSAEKKHEAEIDDNFTFHPFLTLL